MILSLWKTLHRKESHFQSFSRLNYLYVKRHFFYTSVGERGEDNQNSLEVERLQYICPSQPKSVLGFRKIKFPKVYFLKTGYHHPNFLTGLLVSKNAIVHS